MAVDDCSTEFPCKYYSYPTKPKGACLILKWTVKNFSGLQEDKEYKFPPGVRLLPQCDLEVSFRKSDGIFFLFVENKVENHINLDSTATLSDENGKQLYQEVKKNFLLTSRTDIVPNLRNFADCSLPNGSLVIDIKFEVFNLKSEFFEKSNTVSYERDTEIKLSEDMKNWILEKLPDQITLETKDGQIPANRAMLCARSPVFRKMFDHPTSEQEKNIVVIDDVNGTTLKSLVDFLYFGKTDFPKTELQSLKDLYYAADKYDVQDLRKICAQNMILLLTEENAIGVLVVANQHSDQNLKKECMAFLRTCIQKVMDTEGWVHLKASDPNLAVEVLETCFKVSAAEQKS